MCGLLEHLEEASSNAERVCSHSIDVLSRLYETVRQLELCGDFSASAMFERLLQQAIRPFLLNMECWLSGQSLDSGPEFMIKQYVSVYFFVKLCLLVCTAISLFDRLCFCLLQTRSPQVDLFSAEFWMDGYHIQAEIVIDSGDRNKPSTSTAQISPRFLSESSLKQLLYAGKAMQISLALKSFEVNERFGLTFVGYSCFSVVGA